MSEQNKKRVTLVVVNADGQIRGQTPERVVANPHWQDTDGIQDAFAGAVLLRLLDVDTSDHKDGVWLCYLAQFPPTQIPDNLIECSLPESIFLEHDLRMPWARVNGPEMDLEWAQQFVELKGTCVQVRTWNLSSIWSIPSRSGNVWLKCVPPFFLHEARVLELMADQSVPTLLAHDGHRMLLENMPGRDGYSCSNEERFAGIEQLVKLQTRSIHMKEEFVQAGVPCLTLPIIAEACCQLLIKRRAESETADFIASLPDRLKVLADSDIADVLVHGDFHSGNVRVGVTPPIIFDWGDSFVGHPFLDMAWLRSETVLQEWLALWQKHYPDEDVSMLWQQIRPLARLRTALVYQNFLDNIEPSEHIYHEADVVELIADFQN